MLSHDIVDREKILKEINSLDHTKACQQADIYTKACQQADIYTKACQQAYIYTKACQQADIYTKIISKNADIFAEVLHLPFNALVNEGAFPSVFKLADVTPIFGKDSKNSRDNYIPSCILKKLAKVFENIIHKQMATFMDKYFSKFQCGFRKGYSTQ